jgi:thiosulfate reductase cytochrome b subunit
MSSQIVTSTPRNERLLHPLPLRIMHWINAVAIFIMIGSGWKIYNDDVIFGILHFPDSVVIGKWAQYGLQWHFFGMWIFVLNGIAYLSYGIATGRFRRKLFPISVTGFIATVGDALRFRLSHDDLTHYNAVQKILYLGVMLIGILIVISGLALWKPVQFSELANLFGSFQNIRLVHFFCMTAIVAFILVHVTLALLVPRSLVAMLTGGPVVKDDVLKDDVEAKAARAAHACTNRRQFGAIRTEPGNLRLHRTAWWGWKDSNFQPNDYQLLASEVPEVARLCVRAPGLCKKPIEFQ